MSRKEQFSRKDLPDELRQQFAVVERRLWRVETAMAVCLAAAGLFGSYLGLFFSDRLWDSPGWLRLGLLAAGVGITVGLGGDVGGDLSGDHYVAGRDAVPAAVDTLG